MVRSSRATHTRNFSFRENNSTSYVAGALVGVSLIVGRSEGCDNIVGISEGEIDGV